MVAIVRLIERFSGLIGLIGAWVMLPLILSMVYEVLARHFFNAPTFWAYEVGYMLAGTTYMFGMGYCLKQGAHIRVDFLYERMSLKRKALVNFLGYIAQKYFNYTFCILFNKVKCQRKRTTKNFLIFLQ